MIKKAWTISVFIAALGFAGATSSMAASSVDYSVKPPFAGQDIKPNVIIAMDISGSMKLPAYAQSGVAWSSQLHTNYDNASSYFGYFDKDLMYLYDTSKGFFRLPDIGIGEVGDWSGNFLNWMSMRRIEAARKVMVGGKVSVLTEDKDCDENDWVDTNGDEIPDPGEWTDTNGNGVVDCSPTFGQTVLVNRHKAADWTNWQATWDGYWVLEGNNEPEDRTIRKAYALNNTDGLTPSVYPDNTEFKITNGQIIPQVVTSSVNIISDTANASVETGIVTMDWTVGDAWKEVEFANSYTNPIVVVKSISEEGGQPVIARVQDVGDASIGANGGFRVRLQEWDYLDGGHTEERIMYLVAERGKYDVDLTSGGSLTFESGDYPTSACGTSNFQSVAYASAYPAGTTPVVFSGVSSFDDAAPVVTRNRNASNTGFEFTMQEEESEGANNCDDGDGGHGSETLHFIAITPGYGTTVGTNQDVEVGVTAKDVTHAWKTVNLTHSFGGAVQVVTDMQTTDGSDPASLRHGSETNSSFQVHVDEEKSGDNEQTHAAEQIGYLATVGNTGFNIMVGVETEPTGLLQDISDTMRIGLAVYNYDHTKDPSEIYKGNTVHGGTLWPAYPDIKRLPANRTTYDISVPTGVHDPVKNIYRVIEEHPLIWGTTPIAETLYDIRNYLQQNDASGNGYYDDKSTNPTYPSGTIGGVNQDPFYYQEFNSLMWCADTFILHFNDGEPWRDFDGAGHPSVPGDGIGNTGDREMLDDMAWELRTNDLRTDTDMDGWQEAITYYVYAALGEDTEFIAATRKMRESAINGGFIDDDDDHMPDPLHNIGGTYSNINDYIEDNETSPGSGIYDCTDKKNEWDADGDCNPDTFYFANDGYQLVTELTAAFASILKRTSSGTAASVISSSRSGEGAVYQSLFYPKLEDSLSRTINWVGKVHSLMVDAYGNMRTDMFWDATSGTVVTDNYRGVKQLNFRNEDFNHNGIRDTTPYSEDVNTNGDLDPGEDLNNNGRLDTAILESDPINDFDGDGQLDRRDLIVVFDGGAVRLWDDQNENGIKDDEDNLYFTPDIPTWRGNNSLDTEDVNNNGVLDPGEDLNSNGALDTEDLNGNGTGPDTELISTPFTAETIDYLWNSQNWLDTILDPTEQRIYNTSAQDRHIFTFVDKDGDMIADDIDNGLNDPLDEIVDFTSWSSVTPAPAASEMTNTNNFWSYLTLYPSYEDKPSWIFDLENLDTTNGNTDYKDAFLVAQTKRVVDYVRGVDQGGTDIQVGAGPALPIPEMRSRLYRNETFGSDLTWRMGDVVSSSPTLVGRPAENYHLIYRDESYAYFLARYLNRRNVVYVGGNDGMVHAFNGGFFDYETSTFTKAIAEPFIDADNSGTWNAGELFADLNNNGTWDGATQTQHELGAELWAYVPYNLLPHLYWTTEPEYQHVYYNDLTPKIFDAKIFPFDPGDPLADPDHPYGWGTVMVIGMRFGGGNIYADTNKDDRMDADNDGTIDATDVKMTSSYTIFDITNPEEPPVVLAEITLPGMGYTTCFPTVAPLRSRNESGSNVTFDTNMWYLVFGSGPADANGNAASKDVAGRVLLSGSEGDSDILVNGVSEQNAKLYAVNLNKLTDTTPEVEVVDTTGAAVVVNSSSTAAHIEELDADSFVSQPITIDFDLNFNPEVIYFGTVNDESGSWGGKMRRLIIDDSILTTDWVANLEVETGFIIDRADNTLLDLTASGVNGINQPITAAASATVGEPVTFDIDGSDQIAHVPNGFDRERWVYFGTGRYFVGGDASDGSQQSYYGIKEPYLTTGEGFTWREVTIGQLLDSTNINIFDDGSVENHPVAGVDTYSELIHLMEDGTYQGWYVDFTDTNERNLGQAALLGGLLGFTTFMPNDDQCVIEGSSNLYARWYQTGTPLRFSVFRSGNTHHDGRGGSTADGIVDKGEVQISGKISLGSGMALTPNIHTGRKTGSTAYIQTSTGDIITIHQEGGGETKSHKTQWNQIR